MKSKEQKDAELGGAIIKKAIAVVLGALCFVYLLIALLLGSWFKVSEQEQAVVTRFGQVVDVKTAGLYFKLPMFDKVNKVSTMTLGMPIGYVLDEGSGEDGGGTYVESESMMITSDFNIINTDFYLEYRVVDPVKYLYNSLDPVTILRNEAQAAIRSTVTNYTVDDVMTTSKNKVQSEVKETLIKELAKNDIGIEIVNVSVQDVEPPTYEVMDAFKQVENAKQGAETALNNANKYKSENIPAAEANADKIVKDAEAKRDARIAEAEGQVSRFNSMYEQYKLNPLITKQRMFYETMEDVLPGSKVIINDGGTQTMLPLEKFSDVSVVNNAETEASQAN